nr:peptidase domain-containing ABC transporter [uncultured Chitinophaga sp.]
MRVKRGKFPIYRQFDAMDCGPTCLRMIARYYGKSYSLEYLRNISYLTREGVSLMGIGEAAEKIGFRTISYRLTFQQLDEEANLPCILYWNERHFVVLPPQNYDGKNTRQKLLIADPAHGMVKVDRETFIKSWMGNNPDGIVMLLEPTGSFYEDNEENKETKKGFRFLFSYLRPYRRHVLQLFLSVAIASALSLVLPFLTQSLVDYGINHQNLGFVYLVLISQLLLFAGNTAIELIRSWILLHMNSRINITILSDFLIKLMKLPLHFFDTKQIGDIHQRIADHQRIQNFLTGASISTLFSFINLIVFMVVLGIYSMTVLTIFMIFSAAAVGWIFFFLHYRRSLDYKRFQRMSENENLLFELITGMHEIKLNNCETAKRWEWERVQTKLYKISVKSLSLGQYQSVGSMFFNQLKNILISYVSAREVMSGNMTLGMMLSVSYIIGQMNGPLDQLLSFVQSAQDARISLDRLSEVHTQREEEEEMMTIKDDETPDIMFEQRLGGIRLEDVSFQYEGPLSPKVLKNIHLHIPEGKVTAIVGSSGSGKTTLLKLLLRFYEITGGQIQVGDSDIRQLSPRWWRKQCGVVMQDGFIFSDTITRNITISDEKPDRKRLAHAVKVANIQEFIEGLPLGYKTKIGNSGAGISMGQKQRIQIARAVYKSPAYLFFDEATSALDANNEKVIMNNLQQFFKGKTVVVIAHRLSTVKDADQIVVLEHGEIVETGTHQELAHRKGRYYELVKNQLELGA